MQHKVKGSEIIPFKEALKVSLDKNNIREYSTEDWLYVPHEYFDYRYILGTLGNKPLITIGINPSTAQPNKLDPTLKSVERIALNNGFDSFIMMNIYAQRATDPNNMHKENFEFLHEENLQAFKWLCETYGQNAKIWGAWGSLISKRPYLKACLKDILGVTEKYGVMWLKAGALLKSGHPHHPLYLRKNTELDEFNINEYLENL